MTVVRNEFEAGENDPAGILQERVISTAYLWHNYGKSTIGAKADLENVPIERLQAFYRTYYQPDNAVLLIAGRFDEAKTIALVQQTFGPIPKPSRTLPAFYTLDPTQDGERQVVLERVGDVQALAAAYHIPSGASPDSGAIAILNRVLTDTPSGRLEKALVDTKKAASVGGYSMDLHDPGYLMFSAEVRQDQPIAEARTDVSRDARRGGRRVADHPGGGRARARDDPQELSSLRSTTRSASACSSRSTSARATGVSSILNRDRVRAATRRGRPRGGGGLPQAFQPHGRHLPPDGQARPRRDPAASGRRRARRGVQGGSSARGGRDLRRVAREHRLADEALRAAGRHEARAPAEEDARRDRRRDRRPALRRPEEPRGPGDGGGAGGRHADARDDPALAPADPGRARPSQGAHHRGRERGPGGPLLRDHPGEPSRGPAARGRDPARAGVSGRRVREAPPGVPGLDRAAEERAGRARLEPLRAAHEPVSAGRRASRRHARRVLRGVPVRDARGRGRVPPRFLRRIERPDGGRRRLRRNRDRGARGRALRKLEEPGELRPDPEPVPRRRRPFTNPSRHRTRRTRSSSRVRTSSFATTTRTIPRSSSATSCSASPTPRGSTSGSARRRASPTASVRSSRRRPSRHPGEFTAYAISAPQNAAKVEAAFREELARARERRLRREGDRRREVGMAAVAGDRARPGRHARALAREQPLPRAHVRLERGARPKGEGR